MSLQGVLARKGAPVTFTHVAPGTHDATAAGFGAPVKTIVKGWAMRVQGDPERYRALELIESEAPTLMFVPRTRGELPAIDSRLPWGGVEYSVKHVDPVSLNGVATSATIVVSR